MAQFKACYSEPYVVKASLMPDAHVGYVAPIGHASTLPSPQTIMRAEGPYLEVSPGPADCEAGRIIYEPTFAPRESYDRTLGLNFFRQYTTP